MTGSVSKQRESILREQLKDKANESDGVNPQAEERYRRMWEMLLSFPTLPEDRNYHEGRSK